MPETEVELENASPQPSPTGHRKSTKPLMEKRRRARINASLTELKALLLDVMKKEGARHHKMEKADILEMTVKHLRQIQRQQFTVALAEDPSVLDKYQTGFNECVNEVNRYLDNLEGLTPEVRSRLLQHLTKCLSGVSNHQVSAASTAIRNLASTNGGSPSPPLLSPNGTNIIPEINNNSIPNLQTALQGLSVLSNGLVTTSQNQNFNGMRILPSRGNVAFVIPSNMLGSQLGGQQVPGYIIPLYTGIQQQQQQQQTSDSCQSPKGPLSPQPLVVIPSSVPSPSSTASSPRSRPSSASDSMPLSPASSVHDFSDADTPPSPHRGAFTPVRPQPYTTRPENRTRSPTSPVVMTTSRPLMHPNTIPAHQGHSLSPYHAQRVMPEPLDVSLRPHAADVKMEHKDDMWRPW